MTKRALEIVFIADLYGKDKSLSFSPISELVALLNPAIPEYVSQVILEYKFMLFVPPEDEPNDRGLVLVFGPVYRTPHGNEGYRHSELYREAVRLTPELAKYRASGGKLHVVLGAAFPMAELGGSSGDFGVFDPILLDYRKQIVQTLKLALSFKFNDFVK